VSFLREDVRTGWRHYLSTPLYKVAAKDVKGHFASSLAPRRGQNVDVTKANRNFIADICEKLKNDEAIGQLTKGNVISPLTFLCRSDAYFSREIVFVVSYFSEFDESSFVSLRQAFCLRYFNQNH
jgi:hypothetical protein